jgi:hypothetical protein
VCMYGMSRRGIGKRFLATSTLPAARGVLRKGFQTSTSYQSRRVVALYI